LQMLRFIRFILLFLLFISGCCCCFCQWFGGRWNCSSLVELAKLKSIIFDFNLSS
jgi:hypothetical protein